MPFEIEQEHELDYQLYSLITILHIKTKRILSYIYIWLNIYFLPLKTCFIFIPLKNILQNCLFKFLFMVLFSSSKFHVYYNYELVWIDYLC
jgi:hypothetical protein